MPNNPHELKQDIVASGLKASGFTAGELASKPFKAVEILGDPMIPAVAGIVAGSSIPVTLAGGTQMTAVCAIIKEVVTGFDWNNLFCLVGKIITFFLGNEPPGKGSRFTSI